jgi:methionine synthase II (cobalamin-independent)
VTEFETPSGLPAWGWPRGTATGVGSLPGTDIVEAVKFVLGEVTTLPFLPELPARGPGADMIGRGTGLLPGLTIELYAGRWRVASRPGRDSRRVADLWERDLDALTEQAVGYQGPVKLAVAGPWTLAASLELPVGGPILRDHGAVRDLADCLAEGVREHVGLVRRRLPGATVLLQLDEPSLPAVLAGRIPTESGLATLRTVEAVTARERLGAVVTAARGAGAAVGVHCCAADVPIGLLRTAGANAISLDLSRLTDLDPLGEAIEAGVGLIAGAVPTTAPAGRLDPAAVADRVRTLWRRLGFPAARLADQVAVSPACGLASATPGYARAALTACVEAGRRLAEDG